MDDQNADDESRSGQDDDEKRRGRGLLAPWLVTGSIVLGAIADLHQVFTA